MKPRDLADRLVEALPASDAIQKTDIAGPGFINFLPPLTPLHKSSLRYWIAAMRLAAA